MSLQSIQNLTMLTTSTDEGTYFTYSIPGMDISPGLMPFTFVSAFLSLITPKELPFDLIHDALHRNLTLLEFATNAIKIESGFIAIMSIFTILAFVPIIATCAWCCGNRGADTTVPNAYNRGRESPPSINIVDESSQDILNCRKRASVIALWIAFIFLLLSDFCIFYANSRLAASIEMAPEMIKSTVHDMEVFLKDTHLQIKHRVDNGFHVSVEKVAKDLQDVDVLLGEPIQAEISAHTGIELAYDSLATISLANAELIYRVLMLQETVGRAFKISQEAANRMEELQIQLSVLQRQCTYRDRPLCDTLRIRSFEENGIIDALKTLQEDQTIFRMRYLGEIEFGATVKNLTAEVGVSRSIFSNFPQQVKHDTSYERNYTLEQLDLIRHRTTANAQMLTATITVLLERLQGVWDSIQPHYEKIGEWSKVYWTSGWVTAMLIIWVLLFMLISYCCFVCESNMKAGFVLFIAVVIVCIGSLFITFYGVMTLAIGGNMEVFLCRPLYEHGGGNNGQQVIFNNNHNPINNNNNKNNINRRFNNAPMEFHMLGKLFDKPGYVYAEEPQTGIIGELLRPTGINRSIVNVTLATAISACEKNQASYNVFQLDAFVNTTKIADLKQFPKVTTAIESIAVSERTLLSLTQSIQNILENMLHTSTFNLSSYRASISTPTPEKDLATFIDQMQRVALQIQDVATSSRMTTLGSRSKRLQASILQPLEQLQNEILYHLTALELQRDPWAKQVNQTLNHLRTVQDYLEKTVAEICHNQTQIYTERLKAYLTTSKATMSSQLGDTTAKCRPFFDIFDANRIFLCKNIADFLNSLWFFAFTALVWWSIGTPIGLNMINIQRKLNNLKKPQTRLKSRSTENSHKHNRTDHSRSRSKTLNQSCRQELSSNNALKETSPNALRTRPQLKRSATEETLDIDDDRVATQQEHSIHYDRETRSREREISIPREMLRMSGTPAKNSGSFRRSEVEDNWGSSCASRATSMERDREQNQSKYFDNNNKNKNKPVLHRQGTESFDLEDENNWQSTTNPIQHTIRIENCREEDWDSNQNIDRNGEDSQKDRRIFTMTRDKSKFGYERKWQRDKRSTTPNLPANPDSQPATPMQRTPTRLRNHVSLTTRAVANIVKSNNARKQKLQRSGTEEYDMDEDEGHYGASASNSSAVAAARRTPPRTVPPPPPPPAPVPFTGATNSFRNVRWTPNTEDDDEVTFEDAA